MQSHKKQFRNKMLGLTLVELMITVAIAAIVASIAVPSFERMLERNRLKEAVESLKSDLLFARTQAIKKSTNISLIRQTGDNGTWCYGITAKAGGCDCSATPSDCEIKTVLGVNFSQTNIKSVFSGQTTFESRRGTASTANTCFSTEHYTVKVKTSRLGRTTICTNNNANALPGYDYCDADESVCAL